MADELPTGGDSAGRFVTFSGGGFGTVQIERAIGADPAPRPVTARAYLRDHLPAIYADNDFAKRFVSAFESVLDPLVGTLDNLPEHFDAACAPRDVLELMTDWLALERDELRSGDERRRIVERAPELMRLRGTRAGIELALELAFPRVPFRVEDSGGVRWSLDPRADRKVAPASFVVYCDVPLADDTQAAVARLIEQAKPAHVAYRLRVRSSEPERGGGE